MNIILGFLRGLKLPVKLLKGLFRKRIKKTELKKKCYRHVRLNAPSNVSGQKSVGKDKRKKSKKVKRDRKFSCKKSNNFSKKCNY